MISIHGGKQELPPSSFSWAAAAAELSWRCKASMLLQRAAQTAALMAGTTQQQFVIGSASRTVSVALQCCAAGTLLEAIAGAHQLLTVRAASSKGRGGRKTPSNVRGYDRLLRQWAHMTARPGSSNSNSRGKARRTHGKTSIYAG